jgi:hypothetical protein
MKLGFQFELCLLVIMHLHFGGAKCQTLFFHTLLYMFFPCILAISSLCQDETEAQVEKLKDAAARASVIGLEGPQ